MNASPAWAREILAFWFDELSPEDWYRSNAALDSQIRDRFLEHWENRQDEAPDAFMANAGTALAATILFDQFSRNMFRDDVRAFSCDPLARDIADAAIAKGFDGEVDESHRKFFYMPFMHSEDIADQERCVALFKTFSGEGSLKFAKAHRDVIAELGRFPHRNEALGRETTAAERVAIENGAAW
ncbi:MAG: DUF924 domain-containing protein [Sphingomonadaceae bacterium]|nr:DUF924 domain-containing protein [Sphingomonadaceae bacterium]